MIESPAGVGTTLRVESPMTIRIFIIEGLGLLRAGLRWVLNNEPGMEVVGEVGDGQEALRLVQGLCPDVVILDLSLPGENGIEITQQVKQLLPNTHVLILSIHEDESLLRAAIRAKASGYVVQRAAESELTGAVRSVCQGNLYVHPVMTRTLLKDLLPPANGGAGAKERLTKREKEVLRLLAQGHVNRQIAELLNLSIRTVESHRANITDKLGLHSRIDLTRYAHAHGILT